MIILNNQRRSFFFVILSSSIPFCILDDFITNNKDALRHNHTTSVNLIVTIRFLFYSESLSKACDHHINNNRDKDSPFFSVVNPFPSCPFLHFYLQQSSSTNSTGNTSGSSVGRFASKTDGTPSTGSGIPTHSSHIMTNQFPYQMSHPNNHYNNARSYYRGSGYLRHDPAPKKTTGIPRDDLIHVPRHIPGAYGYQTGGSVVPRPMA